MPRLRRRVLVCGTVSLLFYVLLTVVSHSAISYGLSMWAFLIVASATTLSPLLLMIGNGPASAGADDARLAFRFAISFGIAAAFALPIFGGDFWYYLAEGRLGAEGGNVYKDVLTSAALEQLPVPEDALRITMPYGPGWVWIGTALSHLTASRIVWEFAAYKAVMLAAWLATLRWVYSAHRSQPARQFQSVLWLGWLPFPIIAAVGDAHNDIVMVALMTAWLVNATPTNAVLLVASALVKYSSLAVVALAAIDAAGRRSWRSMLVIGAAGAAALVVAVLYWQDGALIAGLQRNQNWRIYTPIAFIDWLVRARGLPESAAILGRAVWRLVLAAVVVWYALRYRRTPTQASIAALATAVFLAIILGSGYTHTHYFLWLLPALLLASDRWLMVLAAPYIIFFPFMQILRLSRIGMSTSFRLTFTLQVLVVACWIVCAWRFRTGTDANHPALPISDGVAS